MFLKKHLNPTNFIISNEKYLLMGGRPMPECSMVHWLFGIVVEYLGPYQMFLDGFNL